ncbi:hypothetical protein GYB29_15270 [bacterium]|nr:hypothetical protein [bacterium]
MENKLRHIDDLLKTSLGAQHDDAVNLDSDWLAVEKRLNQRSNRIYAMWFSLALIALVGGTALFMQLRPNQIVETDSSNQESYVENNSDQNVDTENRDINNINSGDNDQIQPMVESPETNLEEPSSNIIPNKGIANNGTSSNSGNSDNVATNSNNTDNNNSVDDQPKPLSISGGWPWTGIGLNSLSNFEFESYDKVNLYSVIQDDVNEDIEELRNQLADRSRKRNGFSIDHIELGVSFTPSFADKTVTTNEARAGFIHQDYFDKVTVDEYAAPTTSSSLNIEVHLRNGLFFGSGIGLSQRAEYVNYDFINDKAPAAVNENGIPSYVPYFEEVRFEGSNSYHFLEIPFTLGYNIDFGRRWSFRTQADVSYMLLTSKIGQRVGYTYLGLENLDTVNYFNRSNWSATFKSGIYLNFKKFVIGAEPVFSTNLNYFTDETAAIRLKPFSYGLNITTNIKLYR